MASVKLLGSVIFWGCAVIAIAGMATVANASLNTKDPHIISLYLFDEQTSGHIINDVNVNDANIPRAFYDKAVTGTTQNWDPFKEDDVNYPSEGPTWGTGADFQNQGINIGTGTGLIFHNAQHDRTRVQHWLDVSQGAYANGGSFTIMVRAYPTAAVDGNNYPLFSSRTHHLLFQGTSRGVLNIWGMLRCGSGTRPVWYFSSDAANYFGVLPNKWSNIFLIYSFNSSLTLAADDGREFLHLTSTPLDANLPLSYQKPAGWDSTFNPADPNTGFADSSGPWEIGYSPQYEVPPDITNPDFFDGRIECIAVWDKALTLAEADAINLDNVSVPVSPECQAAIASGNRLAGDTNGDCYVDMHDIAQLVSQWLLCNFPNQSGCVVNW
jgi:hypothetical protein